MISNLLRCSHPDPDEGQDSETSAKNPEVSGGDQGPGPVGLGELVLTLGEGTVPVQDHVREILGTGGAEIPGLEGKDPLSRISTGINHLFPRIRRKV